MQGHGKRQLQIAFGKLFDLVDEAAGGKADVAHPDVHAVRAVDKLQKTHDVVEVIQWFADAHQDNVGDRQAGIQLGKKHLIKKLRRLQPPDKAADGRRAELAAHRASDLRGDADGVAVVVLHDDGFDAVAVTQLPEIFDRPVKPGDLLAGDGGLIDEIEAVQRFAQGLGEVRHGLEADCAAVQPREDLLCAEFRFAKRRERVLQLGQRHGFDILFHACFLSLQMKKPSAACLCGRSAA